jgi:hypothetical protein
MPAVLMKGTAVEEVPSLMRYRTTVITVTQVGSWGDVCPQPASSGVRVQRHLADLRGTTGAFGIGSKTNDQAFAATQHREAPS